MEDGVFKDILNSTDSYYTSKAELFGETPRGVDWNSEDAMRLRIEQLIKIVDTSKSFSINDLG